MVDSQSTNNNIFEICSIKVIIEGNSVKPILLVKAVTWKKDTHSLFDYQFTKNIEKDEIKVSLQPGFIFMYRNNESKFA